MTSPVAEGDRWIQRFSKAPESKAKLICFPHAGGSASYFYPFAAQLAPDIDVQAVQYPGRQERRLERFIDNIPEMADRVFAALRPRVVSRLFAFFGHSMGAVVALEVARRFQRQNEAGPCWLFVSGRRAPSRRRNDTIHLRDDAGLLAELRMVGGTDSRILDDEELRDMILPVARNDYKAIETYACEPAPPLRCPVTVLVGASDPQVTVDEAAAWAEHSAAEFDLHVFPGGHFYLEACRTQVGAAVMAALKGVWSGESASVGSHQS